MIGLLKKSLSVTLFGLTMTVQIVHAASPPDVAPPPMGDVKNRYDAAVIIGNENYYRLPQATYAYNDALAMTDVMKKSRRLSKYRTKYIQNAKQSEINKSLTKYYRRTSKKGTLWIYFAGHGHTDENGNRYILPIDADPNNLLNDAIEVNDIFEQTSKKGNRVVLIIDSGFGNTGRDGLPTNDFKENTPYDVANNNPKQILWIPDSKNKQSPIYIQAQHSVFTYLILGGIKGWADGEIDGNRDQTITMGEWQRFVNHKMTQLGQPNQPSIFDHPEVNDLIVLPAQELSQTPNDALFEEMSIGIRMRNFSNQADSLRAEAAKVWNDVLYDVQKGGAQGEEALKRYLERYQKTSISVEWMVHIPEVLQAQRLLKDYGNLGNILAFDPAICEVPEELEPDAMLGEMSREAIACLEAKLRLERIQSEKSKVSLLLINNDMSAKDWDSWEFRVRNHLKNIDRSQPDLTFSFAIYLNNKGSEYFNEALYWTDYTMETRSQWPEGSTFVEKTNKLLQIRAQLALEIWMEAEKSYTRERTPELEQISTEARGVAKNLAREWLDYTRQAELPSEDAFNYCMSTSPDPEFCKK